jgi:hypothetical protein
VFCHRYGDNFSEFQLFVGVQSARETLARALVRSESIPPILIFGADDEQHVRDCASRYWPGAAAVLDWSGIAYLDYDVTREALLTAAEQVAVGAVQGSLAGFFRADQTGLLRVSSEIRHWLENRRTSVTGMRDDFRREPGDSVISRFHLEPQPVIGVEHRAMVDRLWAYEWLAAEYLREIGGTGPMRAAMSDFEAQWRELSNAKSAFRYGETYGQGGKRIAAMLDCADRVLQAIQAAIDETRVLDRAVEGK